MSRFAQRTGFAVVFGLLLINQFLRHIQSHTHQILKLHLKAQGVVEQEVGGVVMLSHGNPDEAANIILPDMFDELYSWSLQIEELPDDDHWMLLDLPIIQSEAQEQIEVEMVGQTLIEAWKSHGKGVHRLIAHGTSATLALEALENSPEYVQKLILINPLLPGYFPDGAQLLPQTKTKVSERLSQFTGTDESAILIPLLDSWVTHYQQPAYQLLLNTLNAHSVKPFSSEIEVEVIWSEPNPYGSVQLKQQIELQFPNAKWTVLQNCGFAPHYRCDDKLSELLVD